MDSLLSSDFFLPILLGVVGVFAALMRLLQHFYPNLAPASRDSYSYNAEHKQTEGAPWTVDLNGRPTPYSDNQNISGGF